MAGSELTWLMSFISRLGCRARRRLQARPTPGCRGQPLGCYSWLVSKSALTDLAPALVSAGKARVTWQDDSEA